MVIEQSLESKVTSVKKQIIPFSRPTLSRNELKSVLETLIHEDLAYGSGVVNFEREFAKAFDFQHAMACDSYTSAFHLSLMSVGLQKGDEIIIPASAPLAIIDAIHYVGGTPIICDLGRDSFHPQVTEIMKLISEKTKVIYLYYAFGSFQDYKDLYVQLEQSGLKKNDRKIKVIEDISFNAGQEIKNTMVGSDADIAICGLNEEHLMTIGKGAVVLTDSNNTYAVLKDLRIHGGNRPYRMRFDYAITDYQAALGLEQLGNLRAIVERRKKIGAFYNDALRSSKLISYFNAGDIDLYGFFPVIADTPLEHTQRYFASLQIEIKRVFSAGPAYQLLGSSALNFPNAEKLYQKAVALPLYPLLNKASVEKVMMAIKGFY